MRRRTISRRSLLRGTAAIGGLTGLDLARFETHYSVYTMRQASRVGQTQAVQVECMPRGHH